MTDIRYITMDSDARADIVVAMMASLYAEDPAASPVDASRFPETIRVLLANPQRGRIILLQQVDEIVGYSILIPLWSNEFGGTVLLVDELFVLPDSRGQGIGRGLFDFISRERPFEAVAVLLEVSPANDRARKLYRSLGLEERQNSMLVKRLGARSDGS